MSRYFCRMNQLHKHTALAHTALAHAARPDGKCRVNEHAHGTHLLVRWKRLQKS